MWTLCQCNILWLQTQLNTNYKSISPWFSPFTFFHTSQQIHKPLLSVSSLKINPEFSHCYVSGNNNTLDISCLDCCNNLLAYALTALQSILNAAEYPLKMSIHHIASLLKIFQCLPISPWVKAKVYTMNITLCVSCFTLHFWPCHTPWHTPAAGSVHLLFLLLELECSFPGYLVDPSFPHFYLGFT